MNYQVTARKWRPKLFADVVGQEHITSTLKNAIKENRIAHAYLFTGPRGVGKTTTARIFAKTLNCINPTNAEPCNDCEMCKAIQNSQLMDIIEIDGASNRGIDEIRTLRESVKYAPTRGKFKVYIIDEVHMLTKESFNAFLKTLEEPPAHIIFIFATTDVHKVPLTIISRCQRYDFRRIQLDTIKATLAKIAAEEKIKIDDTTLTIISKKADGALRDAESYFDQVIAYCQGKIDPATVAQMLNLIDEELYFKISDAIVNKNYNAVFEASTIIYENGWDFIDFMNGLTEHFRNILTVIISGKSDFAETAEVFKIKYLEYRDQFTESDLLRLLNFLNKVNQELKYSQNQKLKIEIALSHLVGMEKTSTLTEMISNLKSDSGSSDSDHIKIISSSKTESLKKNDDDFSKSSNSSIIHSIHKPVQKEKVEQSVEMPMIEIRQSELNFENIIKKWQGFIDEINKEKALTLASVMGNLDLLSLNGNHLLVSLIDPHNRKTFEMHEKYIENKSENYFGKRLKFQMNIADSVSKISDIAETSETKSSIQQKRETSDPYEQFIVDELGGQKLEL
ncbi:MAG TPA: DNA polymerase III subunit gamma/tau [Ignavibacteriaceae bacterium]|nr:DNA polymerase III subunit gamma/tau [Ignavibacteriaceae bacterium]